MPLLRERPWSIASVVLGAVALVGATGSIFVVPSRAGYPVPDSWVLPALALFVLSVPLAVSGAVAAYVGATHAEGRAALVGLGLSVVAAVSFAVLTPVLVRLLFI
jgi:uncharacterized membrane protein